LHSLAIGANKSGFEIIVIMPYFLTDRAPGDQSGAIHGKRLIEDVGIRSYSWKFRGISQMATFQGYW